MDLLSVTYSQFDNIVGTKLLYSYPEIVSKDVFESVSDYVIVGRHLCGKILIIKTKDIHYINFPMVIENSKYERNALLFSFGFVLTLTADPQRFEPILRKISYTFLQMELEREFLFQESTRSTISDIARGLYEDLRLFGEAFIDIDPSNVIAVKLMNPVSLPPSINDCDVPILCVDQNYLQQLPWDISLRHVLNYIDGVSSVKQISTGDASMDVSIVKRCIQTLLYYHCVVVTDIVSFSNVYRLTPDGLQEMLNFECSPLLPELLQFCGAVTSISSTPYGQYLAPTIASPGGLSSSERLQHMATIRAIQKFICALRPGRKLATVILMHGKEMRGINIRRLLAYCQHRAWIRRVHEYPIDLTGSKLTNCGPSVERIPPSEDTALSQSPCGVSLTGVQSLDEICAGNGIAQKLVVSTPAVAVIMK